MTLTTFVEQLFTLVVCPLILIGGTYLVYLASTKISQLKKNTDSDLAKKYLDMLDNTITNTVLATTQTYVESLKAEGKFDAEAQRIAFGKTYEAVMKTLTDESKKYIAVAIGDIDTYVTNRIEAEVAYNKKY